MFVLELAFDDNPARLAARPAHRERLGVLNAEGRVLACGPWADESGALLVFAVDSLAEAEAIIAADDYYRAPGVTVVSLRQWEAVTRAPAIAEL